MIIKILAVILILLILIMLLKIKAELCYVDKKLSVYLKILFFKIKVRSNKKVKSVKETKTAGDKSENEGILFADRLIEAQEKINHFCERYTKLSALTKKYLNVEEFKVNLSVGTGDAATTAISVGALWGVVYSFIGALGMLVYINEPKVALTPNYSEAEFKTEAQCIICCRIVHIIFIMISILLNIKRAGGRKNERTSN